MTFDRSNLKTIRNDIDAALAAVEKKHGIKFNLGNIRYSANDFRTKLECVSVTSANGAPVDADKVKFEQNAFLFGVKKDAFGKSFTSHGRRFTITGINPRAKRYPVTAVGPQGGGYKFPVDSLPAKLRA